MDTRQSQSGSAHLIVIILLVVALIGALGFVYYQNFMQQKDITTLADDTTINKDYIVLDDWNVKFKLPTNLGSNVITYQKATNSNSEDYYKFSTERVSALGGDCTSLNWLYRMVDPIEPDASPPILAGKFGGYYYYAYNRQEICSEDSNINGNIQFQDINMLKAFLTTIEPK